MARFRIDLVKRCLRRWALRRLIHLCAWCEDRLHTAEVALRAHLQSERVQNDLTLATNLSQRGEVPAGAYTDRPRRTTETFEQWEAQRSGVAPVKKQRQRGMTAAAFDLKFSSR